MRLLVDCSIANDGMTRTCAHQGKSGSGCSKNIKTFTMQGSRAGRAMGKEGAGREGVGWFMSKQSRAHLQGKRKGDGSGKVGGNGSIYKKKASHGVTCIRWWGCLPLLMRTNLNYVDSGASSASRPGSTDAEATAAAACDIVPLSSIER